MNCQCATTSRVVAPSFALTFNRTTARDFGRRSLRKRVVGAIPDGVRYGILLIIARVLHSFFFSFFSPGKKGGFPLAHDLCLAMRVYVRGAFGSDETPHSARSREYSYDVRFYYSTRDFRSIVMPPPVLFFSSLCFSLSFVLPNLSLSFFDVKTTRAKTNDTCSAR